MQLQVAGVCAAAVGYKWDSDTQNTEFHGGSKLFYSWTYIVPFIAIWDHRLKKKMTGTLMVKYNSMDS